MVYILMTSWTFLVFFQLYCLNREGEGLKRLLRKRNLVVYLQAIIIFMICKNLEGFRLFTSFMALWTLIAISQLVYCLMSFEGERKELFRIKNLLIYLESIIIFLIYNHFMEVFTKLQASGYILNLAKISKMFLLSFFIFLFISFFSDILKNKYVKSTLFHQFFIVLVSIPLIRNKTLLLVSIFIFIFSLICLFSNKTDQLNFSNIYKKKLK